MASFDGGATSHGAGSYGRRNYDVVDISSDSGSSYNSSRSRASFVRPCPFQTDRFYDQECSRYFDCPTHAVERLLSDDEPDPNDDSLDSGSPRQGDQDQPQDQPSGASSQQEGEYHRSDETDSHVPAAPISIHGARREDGVRADIDEQRETIDLTSPTREDAAEQSASGPLRASPTVASERAGPSSDAISPPPVEVLDLSRDDTPASDAQAPALEASSSRPQPSALQQHISPSDSPDHPGEVVLPRWQPDAAVTLCPICRTQFSFFVRKHHCRKCGRVVCNACSPHRITIPYQYIVLPPEQPRLSGQRYPSSFIGTEYDDYGLGGGERVRLCNPCVPDPNITPPQPLASPTQQSPRSHVRSRSNVGAGNMGNPPPSRFQGYFAAGPSQDASARHRSVTHSGPGMGATSSRGPYYYGSAQSRIMAGTPPSYFPSSSSGYPGASSRRYRSMLDVDNASSSSSRDRALPPPPPQIPEEDECPVCHRELPSRELPNFEHLRESHITICISSHSAFVGPTTPTGTSVGSGQTVGTPPPLAMRRTGMFPYVATEKDCVDSAECTICLEEFEVGVRMARLECLCRFHRDCISAWFINHPGRCPVHQHDSFGY